MPQALFYYAPGPNTSPPQGDYSTGDGHYLSPSPEKRYANTVLIVQYVKARCRYFPIYYPYMPVAGPMSMPFLQPP